MRLTQISQSLPDHYPNFSRGAGNKKNGDTGITCLRHTACVRKTFRELWGWY